MRSVRLRLATVLACALALAACDGAGGAPVQDSDEVELGAVPAVSAGALARLSGGLSESDGYRCVVSSPNPGGGPAERYRFDDVELRFPQDVADAAGGRTREVTLRFGRRLGGAGSSAPTVVREARCRVPDTDEALDLVIGALKGARVEAGWAGAPMADAPAETAETAGPGDAALSSCWWEWVSYEYCASLGPVCTDWQTGWRQELVCGGGGGSPGGDHCDEDPTRNGCGPGAPGVIVIGPPPPEPPLPPPPSPAERLEAILEDDPFALLDVPCDKIPAWLAVGGYTPPESVTNRLDALAQNEPWWNTILGNWRVQEIEEAKGGLINMDYFAVELTLPSGQNPGLYLEHIRRNLNDFIDQDRARSGRTPATRAGGRRGRCSRRSATSTSTGSGGGMSTS